MPFYKIFFFLIFLFHNHKITFDIDKEDVYEYRKQTDVPLVTINIFKNNINWEVCNICTWSIQYIRWGMNGPPHVLNEPSVNSCEMHHVVALIDNTCYQKLFLQSSIIILLPLDIKLKIISPGKFVTHIHGPFSTPDWG